jgi:site-specific DNA-methyltransferase (adenine-specific)
LAVAVEDAGFEIKDSVFWLYGSGFPKTKASLKPACEPIVMARKPLEGTLRSNTALHGTGSLNIEGCRIAHNEPAGKPHVGNGGARSGGIMGKPGKARSRATTSASADGRWPANVVLDESQADTLDAARYFYVAKPSGAERPTFNEVRHPTIKPLSLMRWLVKLVTPPDGTVLEPFAGSGTTVEACIIEGFHCIAIEREAEYLPLIQVRIDRQDAA